MHLTFIQFDDDDDGERILSIVFFLSSKALRHFIFVLFLTIFETLFFDGCFDGWWSWSSGWWLFNLFDRCMCVGVILWYNDDDDLWNKKRKKNSLNWLSPISYYVVVAEIFPYGKQKILDSLLNNDDMKSI